MPTILLVSDLQHGRPHRPRAADALVRLAERLEPDVIVVAGDLTQRAKAHEYRAANAFLARLPDVPTVLTPGNHDVPLYRIWERLLTPYRNWRRFVAPQLDSVTRAPGVTVVALNSSAPRRAIVSGRLDTAQIAFAREAFRTSPSSDARVVVVHHHFLRERDGKGGAPLPGAARWLAEFEEMGVDLVLGGHLHQTRVCSSCDVRGRDSGGVSVPLVACGTSTSGRGRGVERDRNSVVWVDVGSERIEVRPYFLEPAAEDFVQGEAIQLDRPTRAADIVVERGG